MIATGLAACAILLFVPGSVAHADPAGDSASQVDAARGTVGADPLQVNVALASVAQAQANRMAERDAIFHNPNLKAEADAAGVNWTAIGENVGVGPNVSAVHDAFMASPAHRANIEHGAYTVIGVATAPAKDGMVFVAQVFAAVSSAPASVAPSAPAPAAPVGAPAIATPKPAASAPAPAVAQPDAPVAAPAAELNAVVGGVVNRDLSL